MADTVLTGIWDPAASSDATRVRDLDDQDNKLARILAERVTWTDRGPLGQRPAISSTAPGNGLRVYIATDQTPVQVHLDVVVAWAQIYPAAMIGSRPVSDVVFSDDPRLLLPARVGDYVDTARPAADSSDGRLLIPNGRGMLVAEYPELFAAIGYSYGGSGPNFLLPSRRGRFHLPASPTRSVGQIDGSETVQLTAAQSGLRDHAHSVYDPGHAHDIGTEDAGGGTLSENDGSVVAGIGGGGGPTLAKTTGGFWTRLRAKARGTGIGIYGSGAADAAAAHPNLPPLLVGTTLIRVR